MNQDFTIEEYEVELKVKSNRSRKAFIVKAQMPNKKSDETTITSMKALVKNKQTGRMNRQDVKDSDAEALQELVNDLFHGGNDEEE